MKYLHGEMLFHFENFIDPAMTRFVYSGEHRSIILAEVAVDDKHYELKEDYIAELEAGVLSLDADMSSLTGSDQLPPWARTRFVPVTIQRDGKTQVFNLSDIERTVQNLLDKPVEQRGVGFGAEEVQGLIDVIKGIIGAK